PSLNYIWSLDAYDKLLLFRFKVYTAINAYLRFIIWFYISFSAHTSQNVLT
ncbi:hypothetical protein LY78DRAFT_588344, partial [Colletotrichum sublineola]